MNNEHVHPLMRAVLNDFAAAMQRVAVPEAPNTDETPEPGQAWPVSQGGGE